MVDLNPPLQFLLRVFVGWVNRQQLEVIDYLKEENRILRERLGDRRLRFTDAQRRRLAEKGKPLGRKVLRDIASIVTPDTIMAWHRKLIAMKWNRVDKCGPGRPRILSEIPALIARMAKENSSWGSTRIQGALSNLGHRVARGTVANVLRSRSPAWKTNAMGHLSSSALGRPGRRGFLHRRSLDPQGTGHTSSWT